MTVTPATGPCVSHGGGSTTDPLGSFSPRRAAQAPAHAECCAGGFFLLAADFALESLGEERHAAGVFHLRVYFFCLLSSCQTKPSVSPHPCEGNSRSSSTAFRKSFQIQTHSLAFAGGEGMGCRLAANVNHVSLPGSPSPWPPGGLCLGLASGGVMATDTCLK